MHHPLLLLLLLLLLLSPPPPSPPHTHPKTGYTQLKPVSGQWKISVAATSGADKGTFTPITCDSPALSAPCNKPPLTADNKDKLKVELQLKDKTLKTIDELKPKRVLVRACYTKASAVDRPWRKAADVIDVSVFFGWCLHMDGVWW